MEGINKYAQSKITPLDNLINRLENPPSRPTYENLNPKYLPTRPPLTLNLTKKTSNEISREPVLTPKTSRTSVNLRTTLNGSFSRVINMTPDGDKVNKDKSHTPSKFKTKESCENSFNNEIRQSNCNPRPPRPDRSSKVLKTRCITTATTSAVQEANKSFLRQTISNANVWKLRNANGALPSPIKSFNNDIPRDKNKSSYENLSFRKKMQSQYTHFPTTTDYKNEGKYKINSTNHSRQNSITEEDPMTPSKLQTASKLETLNFKSKTFLSNNMTQRNSQEKLATSTTLRKEVSMNQTDPTGSFYQLALSQKTSKKLSMKAKEPLSPAIEIKIDDFQLGSCKGEGRFGKVYPARHKKSGFLVAIKQIKKEDVKLMLDQFVMELKINFYANHPNIVKVYGFFSDRLHFYIMMEYMEEGSLYKHIKMQKKFKEEEASVRLFELCQAVDYLHSQDILHRDIKPENIVLSNGVSKLCDFGWAIYSKQRRNTYCGTLDYVCPEILEGESYDNFVDIWAIGVLAYQMLTGKAPFYHISRKETMKSIMNCDFSFPSEMSFGCKMFIKKALQKNPDQRFTIESLLNDRFLSKHKQMC